MSDLRDSGDAWFVAADGGRYWGRYGAAGLLAYDRGIDSVLLQHRVTWSDHGDTWGIPGGARHEGESAYDGAIRESQEEAGVPSGAVQPRYSHVLDRGGWSYTTLLAEVLTPFTPEITDPESHALEWVRIADVESYELHPAFAANWQLLHPLLTSTPVIIVDAANVVGSVPDGWWRDRRGAAERLRNRIEVLASSRDGLRAGFLGLSDSVVPGLTRVHPNWTLVVEGAARGIDSSPHVHVVEAANVGDDAIISEVERCVAVGSRAAVVTSDAALQVRAVAAGAATTRGVKKLLRLLPD